MPDSGKAMNPAVQSSQARSALRAGVGGTEVVVEVVMAVSPEPR